MNPSYFRIKLDKKSAMNRLLEFLKVSNITEPIKIDSSKAIDKAINEDGSWIGIPLFFYENKDWTIFEDLSGWFANLPSKDWLKFAKNNEFLLAGYNDSLSYGQLIVIKNGNVIRDFLDDEQQPQDNINFGKLDGERDLVINSWHEIASFVDEDEIAFSEQGYLWILPRKT